jgi:Rod binding domain-containing protein
MDMQATNSLTAAVSAASGQSVPGIGRPTAAARQPLTQHDRLVEQAQKWVSSTFYGTLLKQMRQSPFRSDMLEGGRGGQMFGSMYDQQLAQRLGRSGPGSRLVHSIVNHIEKGKAAAAYRIHGLAMHADVPLGARSIRPARRR